MSERDMVKQTLAAVESEAKYLDRVLSDVGYHHSQAFKSVEWLHYRQATVKTADLTHALRQVLRMMEAGDSK